MKAKTLMWIGNTVIFFSIALQAVALYLPTLALALATLGYILAAISVPFTIWQAYRSAGEAERELRKIEAQTQEAYSETPKGRMLGALSQQRTEMHTDRQEPHN